MTDNTLTTDQEEFNWFKNNGIFMPMINDTGRNEAYKQAIETISRDKVICDIGCGTGLLSILAARSRAKKVYAIEMDPGRADYARRIIKKVGFDKTIQVINKNFYKLDRNDMPDDIDFFISETIGSPIFNEEIIQLAQASKKWGGVFVPGSMDLHIEIYQDHLIFPLVMRESQAYEFQPDIQIDETYENEINQDFQKQHSVDSTLYTASYIDNLFRQLPEFDDLKLNKLFHSEPITVDFNSGDADVNNIKITVPHEHLPKYNTFFVVLFWTCDMYNGIKMHQQKTWWGNPCKTIYQHIRKPGADLEMWYDPKIENWRLSY